MRPPDYLSPMRIPVTVVLMLAQLWASAQGLQPQSRITGRFDSMTTDHLGQVYATRGGEIMLYSKEGRLLYRYSDLSYGRIGAIDTRNPMKVMVFYPDFSRITFLDNTLSKNREQSLRLDRINLSMVQLVCTSFDNGFWAYDPVYFRLLRFDQHMNVTNSIENVNQVVGANINPDILLEEGDWLYLNDPENGVFRFDIFGTYSKLIPVKGILHMQVRNDALIYSKDSGLYRFDPLLFEEESVTLPSARPVSVRIEKEHLYTLDKEGITIYRYTDPERRE